MRITQQSMMRQYNDRLNQIMTDLNKANDKVLTRRKFSKGYENPSMSVQSNQLRREYHKNTNYLENARTVEERLKETASSIVGLSNTSTDAYTLTLGAAAKSPAERLIIAGQLDTMAQTMIQQINTNIGDKFIFGGSSTKELPFTLEDGKVSFRGIPVDTPKEIESPPDSGIMVANPVYEQLEALSKETMYVDLGFGLKIDNGVVDPGSAFNLATPGINYLGFGQDNNGNSKNIVETISKMAEILRSDSPDEEAFKQLGFNLDDQKNHLLVGMTNLGTNSQFIDSTINRLTSNEDILNTKLVSTELIPQELAITEYQAQDAAYRAALKMGTNLLSTSFMDFMR